MGLRTHRFRAAWCARRATVLVKTFLVQKHEAIVTAVATAIVTLLGSKLISRRGLNSVQ